MDVHTLHLEARVTEVLAWALLRTVDDLEARAIIADHHDPHIGPESAVEYRSDIVRLRTVLDQLHHVSRDPDPEQAAVTWIDGTTYTIVDRHPIRMIADTDPTTPNVPTTSLYSTVTSSTPPSRSQTCTGVPPRRRGPRHRTGGGRC